MTSKVGTKKSLFKKPAWASSSSKPANEDEPVFGQAHHYSEIVQAEKERRERHAARQQERAEKERKEAEERDSKRRRISKEAEDSDYGSDSNVGSVRSGSEKIETAQESAALDPVAIPNKSKGTPPRGTNRTRNQSNTPTSIRTRAQKAKATEQDGAIILDDDSDNSVGPVGTSQPLRGNSGPTKASPSKPPVQQQAETVSESEEEDDYLRELKAKARREAQSKSPVAPKLGENQPFTNLDPTLPTKTSNSRLPRATSTPAAEDEAEVKIWIKTIIPGASEVIVNRKISQPLDKVKEYWIKRNELEPFIAEKVFFTWNGTRLYNSTTMRGIIERLKRTHPTRDGSDPSNGRITIEAVTEEIFEYRQKQAAMRQAEAEKQRNGDNDTDGPEGSGATNRSPGDEDGARGQAPAQKSAGIVIKLKAQGLEELNIRVRPNTTMQKIVHGFCKLRGVDPAKQCWLSYDGDKLDPDTTVEEVGFEEDDAVEVYMR